MMSINYSRPSLIGQWTVGEIQQMAQLLMEWLSQLQVSQPQAAEAQQ